MANTLNSVSGTSVLQMLPDDIRQRFNFNVSYTGYTTSDKWVYKKQLVDFETDAIFTDNDQFLEIYSSNPSEVDASADLVKWIYLRHTGWGNVAETPPSTYGIMLCYNDTTPVFNTATGAAAPMLLTPGDSIFFRVPNTAADDLKFRTCLISSNAISAAATSGQTALIEVAAILQDAA